MENADHRLALVTLAAMRGIRTVEDTLGLTRQAIKEQDAHELQNITDLGVDALKELGNVVAHLTEISVLAKIGENETDNEGAVEFRKIIR